MVLAVLPMVKLVEVAEGVLEPSDHLGTNPDRFLFKNRSWNMFQMFIFMNINGTCCTPHGWACQGRWGCPRALRSPWDPSRSFSLQKSIMKHVSNVHFDEYKWYLLYSTWFSLSSSLRVSYRPQITLGPIQIVFFLKFVHETCFNCSFLWI